MISIVGIGTGASAIARKFSDITQYDVYELSNTVKKNSKRKQKLKKFETPEEYEKSVPDLKTFFKELKDTVQVFIVGTTYSSNYSLGILEQMSHKKLEVFYVKPDIELVNGERSLIERICAFGTF